MRHAPPLAIATLAASCGGQLHAADLPDLAADPPAALLEAGTSGPVTITNTGDEPIRIDEVELLGSAVLVSGLSPLPVELAPGASVEVRVEGARQRGLVVLRGVVEGLEALRTVDVLTEGEDAWAPPTRELVIGVVDSTATDDVYLSMLHLTRYVGETSDVHNLVRSSAAGRCGDVAVPADTWTPWTYAYSVEALHDEGGVVAVSATLACDFTTEETEGWAQQWWYELDGLRRVED